MPKIKILDAGFVNALKMYAPIVNPIIVSTGAIGSILRENHRVIEYNEKGKGIVLTLDNYRDPHRFDEPKKEEETVKSTENPYGKEVSVDTSAPVFTGYTKSTVIDLEPPKASAANETAAISGTKLTKAQKKALAKAKREEQTAKASEPIVMETSVEEVSEVTEESTIETTEDVAAE